MRRKTPLLIAMLSFLPVPALAHPHIFIDAKFEVVAAPDGSISELRNVWSFDEVFSSSVLMDYDKAGSQALNASELKAVGKTVRDSLAQYGYYTNVTSNGKAVPMAKPDAIQADYKNGSLILTFSLKPEQKTFLKGTTTFGIYDKTLYTAVDFATDSDMTSSGTALGRCKRKVIRPNPKEVMAENQAALTSMFFSDPKGTDYSLLVATRLEVQC
ncbi:DUF1007 family protein [Rhizobium miluonense]|uniref:ABC-type uncharacterized transport system, substrate-binding protein n=1 Tax=Rhizobium miluonense TaxID=411945 RepID=A0A1C3X2M7_9HYPH|nr:DUF1007 family protein [Rhizobium miluonense]SCB46445.1 ABC-type uncharacterized transport system, substrate-binding protein [Rhizobium miluonense]